jgi:hypothetical protein
METPKDVNISLKKSVKDYVWGLIWDATSDTVWCSVYGSVQVPMLNIRNPVEQKSNELLNQDKS